MCNLDQERVNADLYELDLMMCGNMAFALSFQEQTLGRGITLHVFESSSTYREIIRFDCFEVKPHYHLNYSDYDHPSIKIPSKSVADSLAWACETMLINAEELLVKSKAGKLMGEIDFDLMENVLADITKAGLLLIKEHKLSSANNSVFPSV